MSVARAGANAALTAPAGAPESRRQGRHFSGWLFAFLALEWFLFCLILGGALITRISFPGISVAIANLVWAAIVTAAVLWGSLYLWLAGRAIRRRHLHLALSHVGIALAAGGIVLGTQILICARTVLDKPVFADTSGLFAVSTEVTPSAAETVTISGDAQQGKQLFVATCSSCHGPTGGGMPNAAPSLLESEFLGSANESQVAGLIRTGRAVGDSANKSGRAMPARGGNPFLTNDKIAHLVAFLKQLSTQGDVGAVAAAPTVQLNRWILPPPSPPPLGSVENTTAVQALLSAFGPAGDGLQTRYTDSMRGLLVAASGLLALHFAVFTGVIGTWAMQSLLICPVQVRRTVLHHAGWIWGLGVFAWIVVLVVFV